MYFLVFDFILSIFGINYGFGRKIIVVIIENWCYLFMVILLAGRSFRGVPAY